MLDNQLSEFQGTANSGHDKSSSDVGKHPTIVAFCYKIYAKVKVVHVSKDATETY